MFTQKRCLCTLVVERLHRTRGLLLVHGFLLVDQGNGLGLRPTLARDNNVTDAHRCLHVAYGRQNPSSGPLIPEVLDVHVLLEWCSICYTPNARHSGV